MSKSIEPIMVRENDGTYINLILRSITAQPWIYIVAFSSLHLLVTQ